MSVRLLFLILLLINSFACPARAEDGSRVLLILDASGSMRGEIDGQTKMQIAKEVVGKIVKTWNPADELGLIAYGHREKGNCKDIEVLKDPGPLDSQSFMQAVKDLNPKGQTPMTAAVRMAAEALQYTEKKATVILVSDGIENCDADPCAVAEELKSAGVGLVVHTVGFGLDNKGAIAQLKCMAEKTGGTFATAENATELQKALTKSIAIKPAVQEPAAIKFNVEGHAILAPGVELPKPFDNPTWQFKKPNALDGTQGAVVDTQYGVDLKTNLEPGDYVLRLETGSGFAEQDIKVEPGKVTKLSPVMNAGIMNFSAMIDEATPLTDEGAAWEITKQDGKYLDTQYGAKRAFLLNAGQYRVTLSLGSAQSESEVTVVPGETKDQVITFGAGKLKATAVFAAGGPAVERGMAFEVLAPDPSGDKPKWIDTKYDAESLFNLPAGQYILKFALGLAQAEQRFEVKSGQVSEITIIANAGFIAAKAEGSNSFVISEGKSGLDGKNKWLTTIYAPEVNIAANAGSYLVQAFNGETLTGEKTVEVKAGERSEVTLP